MTYTITRRRGPHGSTHYTARATGLIHTVGIRSPIGGDGQWLAYVRLRGLGSATTEYDEYVERATAPADAVAAVLRQMPPHHRAEVEPALQAILDAPALEQPR